jgi:hypothetical protein
MHPVNSKRIVLAAVATLGVLLATSYAVSGCRSNSLATARDLVAWQESMLAANTMGHFGGTDPRLPASLAGRKLSSVSVAGFTVQAAHLWNPSGYAFGTTLDVRRSGDQTWTVSRSICFGFGAWTFEMGTITEQ